MAARGVAARPAEVKAAPPSTKASFFVPAHVRERNADGRRHSGHTVYYGSTAAIAQTTSRPLVQLKLLKSLVPDKRIELLTFGLQNRCSTAELIRRFGGFCAISEPSRAQERG